MKYLVKTVSFVACLIMIAACEFGRAPDMTALEEMNKSQSTEECDATCQSFYVMIEKKYGANYEGLCDDNCVAAEWEAYLKTQEGDAKAQTFNYPDECDKKILGTIRNFGFQDSSGEGI